MDHVGKGSTWGTGAEFPSYLLMVRIDLHYGKFSSDTTVSQNRTLEASNAVCSGVRHSLGVLLSVQLYILIHSAAVCLLLP